MIFRSATSNNYHFDRHTYRNFKQHTHEKYHHSPVNKCYRLLTECKTRIIGRFWSSLPRIPLVLVRIPLSLPRNPLQAVDSTISSWPMQRIPRFCLIVNWNREKLYTAVFVPEFHAANFALCGWHVLKLGPGFHCSNGSTLSCTKSVGLCVVMMTRAATRLLFSTEWNKIK